MFDVDGIRAANDLAEIAGHYGKLVRRGKEFVGPCMLHGGDNPGAFTVYEKDGRQRWACFSHACHESSDAGSDVIGFIMLAEGLDFKGACEFLNGGKKHDWKPQISNPPRPKVPDRVTSRPPPDAGVPDMAWRFDRHPNAPPFDPIAARAFRDVDGAILGYECRYPRGCDPDEPDKSPSRMWTWGAYPGQEPRWACGTFNRQRPIFGLDQVAMRLDAAVCVTEGPKKAEAAARLLPQYACVAWVAGVHSWKYHDWSLLQGRRCLLWPDADEPGIEAMQSLAFVLSDPNGLACAVKILDVADMPKGWDAADWTGTTEQLIEWAKPRAKVYERPAVDRSNCNEINGNIVRAVENWPIPSTGTESDAAQSPSPATNGEESPSDPSVTAPDPVEQPQIDAAGPGHTDIPPEPGSTATRPPRKPRKPKPQPDEPEDGEDNPFPMSQDMMADRFAEAQAADWRYVKRWNMWLHYDAEGWHEDEKELIDRLIMEHCRSATYWPEALQLTAGERRRITDRRVGGAVRDTARNDRRIAAGTEEWDADPLLIGIAGGGAFDVRTGYMVPTAREHYLTKRTAIKPEAGKPERWLAHLDRMMDGDVDMIHFIQLWFGYCATGSTIEQCLTMFYGMGQTGKGVTLLTVADVMGSYAVAAGASTFMARQNEAHLTELARLTNSRLVVVDEVPSDAKWNEERIKRATGGGKLTCNFMRSDHFEQTVTWKVTLASNHKPAMRSVGKDMQRRIRLIKCNAGIKDEDVQRDFRQAMVAAEGPQILNWILEGAEEWHREGLPWPEQIKQATLDYVDGLDVLGDWLAAYTEQRGETVRSAAYNSFRRYMEAQGGHPWGVQAWWSAMEDRGYQVRRTSSARFVKGLTLLGDNEPPPIPDWHDR